MHDRGECPNAGRKDYLGFCKKCKKAAGLGAGKLKKGESEEGTAEEGRIDLRTKSTRGKKKVEATGLKKARKRIRKKLGNGVGLVAVARAPEERVAKGEVAGDGQASENRCGVKRRRDKKSGQFSANGGVRRRKGAVVAAGSEGTPVLRGTQASGGGKKKKNAVVAAGSEDIAVLGGSQGSGARKKEMKAVVAAASKDLSLIHI